ncbi:glycosyltransferase [Mucilaginibacter glaciei]|uniref:Glycosyltransferase family 2 protein n=1 Tax=Mucilaginibacter glaciei TaxID=2772109 RepID=A0A926NTH2_9SPHI|nr:glycosyltransferase [Mucilaginibacter glaciei]MBD1394712.1 glycosyltransferase family 2 protein [Mucilaginibacter glaciei]
MRLSVIISTYNPDQKRLSQTIDGLKSQSLAKHEWELIIVDNNSSNYFHNEFDLDWHPSAKIITETKQGLTYARLRGFNELTGDIVVMVDDDNVLNSDYLEQVLSIFNQYPKVASIGGKSSPLFESRPPDWLKEFYGNLALRNLGDNVMISEWANRYPQAAPIGAGMAMRREALDTYIKKITTGQSNISDRTGTSLTSGGDNDLVLEMLRSGWQVGYFPQLTLQHIIPAKRMEVAYLARLIHNTNKSWVQLLQSHGINPWKKIPKWGVLPRKIKAWVTYKAWQNKSSYIKWQGVCGTFEGMAALPEN